MTWLRQCYVLVMSIINNLARVTRLLRSFSFWCDGLWMAGGPFGVDIFFSNSCRVALQSPPRMTPRKIDGTVFFNRFSCLPLSILDLCDMPPAMLMYVFSSVSSVVPLGGQLGRPRRGRGSSAEERRLAPLPGAHRVQHQPSHPHHWHAVAELAQGALVAPPVHHAGQVGGAAWRPVHLADGVVASYSDQFMLLILFLTCLLTSSRVAVLHTPRPLPCWSLWSMFQRSSVAFFSAGSTRGWSLRRSTPRATGAASASCTRSWSRSCSGAWRRTSRSRCPPRWGALRGGNRGVGEVEKSLPDKVGGTPGGQRGGWERSRSCCPPRSGALWRV